MDDKEKAKQLACLGATFAASLPDFLESSGGEAKLPFTEAAIVSGTAASTLLSATFVSVFNTYGPDRASQWFSAVMTDVGRNINLRLAELGIKSSFTIESNIEKTKEEPPK